MSYKPPRKEKQVVTGLQQCTLGVAFIHNLQRSVGICVCICALLMVFPARTPAMAPLADSDLSEIYGGSGVSINPDIMLDITIDTSSWGDSDGISGYANPWPATASGGRVGANNIVISQLHARSRMTDSFSGYDPSTMWKPITIDVATSPSLYNGATFVRLGLGALEISWDHMQLEVALGTSGDNLNQKLGDLYMGRLDLYLNPSSYIDIYNGRGPDQCGVTFTLSSIVDRISMECVSWGDSDGLPLGNIGSGGIVWMESGGSQGWIGLHNIEVGGPISVIGSFAVDINTSSSGVYCSLAGNPVTVAHISFPTNLCLNTAGPITAEVRLDNLRSLDSPDAGVLGSIYISQFDLEIMQESFVDIWAH